ncbi:MAG TPA: hypothetical protein VHE61_09000 [Opitutaceae bacterium]|nr:hypothetical protein [Opitutaceae bacterium]
MPIKQRHIDWSPLRKAFIERASAPKYTDLESEFGVGADVISRAAIEEGWGILRAKHVATKVMESEAGQLLLQAAKGESVVTESIRRAGHSVLEKVQAMIEESRSAKTIRARVDLMTAASFAILNVSKALNQAGLVGMPKTLRERLAQNGDEGGEAWARGLMQQINLAVSLNTETGAVDVTTSPDWDNSGNQASHAQASPSKTPG